MHKKISWNHLLQPKTRNQIQQLDADLCRTYIGMPSMHELLKTILSP